MDSAWIPIKDENCSLPEPFTPVLISQYTGAVFTAQFELVDGWYSVNGLAIQNPEAWMPLPNPYNSENQDEH